MGNPLQKLCSPTGYIITPVGPIKFRGTYANTIKKCYNEHHKYIVWYVSVHLPWIRFRRLRPSEHSPQTVSMSRRWVFGKGTYALLEYALVSWAIVSTLLILFVKRWKKYLSLFFTFLSPQCCRRWFLGRTRRKTAWAWLHEVVLGYRVAASSLLSLKVVPPSSSPQTPPFQTESPLNIVLYMSRHKNPDLSW